MLVRTHTLKTFLFESTMFGVCKFFEMLPNKKYCSNEVRFATRLTLLALSNISDVWIF